MTFEEFFKKKKINLDTFQQGDPALFSEFKIHFEQMGEKSFDHTKKYWFNKLRLRFPAPPEVKVEKVVMENRLAEQTVTETLAEPTPPPSVGFKPRFKAGVTKPSVEQNKETTENTEGVEKPTPALGFKPKFKAPVSKQAESETSDIKNPSLEESATITPEVNDAAEKKDQNPSFEQEKSAAQDHMDATERTIDEESPMDKPTQSPGNKPAYKPRFNMKNIKPKGEDQ